MSSKREIKTEGLGMTEFEATAGSAGHGRPGSGFSSSMVDMTTAYKEPPPVFPATQIKNESLPTGGITMSHEVSAAEGAAELDVLKAILNREGYLNRVAKSARTVHKKFKPEVADILDLIRAASIDVCEAIIRWREVKQDHDAAFMWNNVNYLLKMPSDLDFLTQYLAIETYLGFGLYRNPFVVPAPLEMGASLYADLILNPQALPKNSGAATEGAVIGGMTRNTLRRAYTPSERTREEGAARYDKMEMEKAKKTSPYGTTVKGSANTKEATKVRLGGTPNSIVLNDDMRRIRMSEMVVIKEEEKFGPISRDPEERLVAKVQAETRLAAIELTKDDRRPADEPSVSNKFAPHARNSDIGVKKNAWLPTEIPKNQLENSDLLKRVDDEALPERRGEGKFGGQLAPLTQKGVDTRIRKPVRENVGSQMEFRRYRKKRMLSDRLAEIDELRKSINAQKEALAMATAIDVTSRKSTRGGSSRASANTDQGLIGTMSVPGTPANPNRPKSVSINESLNESDVSLISTERKSTEEDRGMVTSPLPPIAAMSGASESHMHTNGLSEEKFSGATDGDLNNADQDWVRKSRMEHEVQLGEHEAQLNEEQQDIALKLSHIEHDEERMLDIKSSDRKQYAVDRSREIERKRRLLTREEGRRTGNPPIEASNAYDFYAIKCQSAIRGWLARCFTRWYRSASRKASIIIQATMRGKLGRIRVARKRRDSYAQTQIAKIYRGYKARGVGAAMAANKNVGKSALKIQKVMRGHLGRNRAKSKKALDAAAEVARESVDPRALLSSDVRELGRRIQLALEEPETTAFPPDEVLHLIRITTVILQQSRGVMGFTEYNYINARYYGEVDGEDMTWQQAASMLNRSERLIRLVRALAFGPGEKPPRMIQISPQAQILYASQLSNPRWQLKTFEQIGLGSKFCTQLFNWIISVTEVAEKQREFGSFLVSSFPDWLPKMYEMEAKKREADFCIEVATTAIDKMKEVQVQINDPLLSKELNANIAAQEDEIQGKEDIITEQGKLIDELANSQMKREDVAILSMEDRLEDMMDEGEHMTANYKVTQKLANSGDQNAQGRMPELRAELTEHELAIKSLEAQLRLLKEQVKLNTSKRQVSGELPIAIRVKGAAIGEALALKFVAIAKIAVYLHEQGVRHKDDLPLDLLPIISRLENDKDVAHKTHWDLFTDGDAARRQHDLNLNEELVESQKQEIASAEKVRPSDEEMEEERREDDEQAKQERLKKLQYIPNRAINHEMVDRPRPTVIALGRDLPKHVKNKVREEVSRLMPGLFVYLDCAENMGINIHAMQSVLDAKKCIIMMVDQGQTRISRINFVKSFELSLRALIPNPNVIMLVGDEKNSRGGTDHYGADKFDLQNMRDKDIKVSLEGMAWVMLQFQKPEVQKVCTLRSKLVEPPSVEFVHVAEAFFCLQSGIDSIRMPDPNMMAMSWRFVRRLLAEPHKVVESLRDIKRGGSSIKFCQCLSEYQVSKLWPAPHSKARQDDPLMHMMALYVELWVVAETATIERGGMPVQVLSKTGRAGVQAIEVVHDTPDPDDMIYTPNSCGWRMTVAKVVKFALQDLRTMKTVMKINGTLLNVGAYREKSYIYFDTYNSKTSESHVTVVNAEDVPFLLMPNAETLETKGRPKPPQDKKQLYQQLALLLHFDKMNRTTSGSRKVLRCTRDYTLLRKVQTKLNGHSVLIKCFEAALAQLYFKIYMPETGAECTFLLEERARLELLVNADEELELQHVQDDDARKMLALSIDRMLIFPSKTMVNNAMGRLFDANAYHKKGININDTKAQGFKLKIRSHGGAGRTLCKKIVHFTGIPHILQVKLFTLDSLLLVTAYEPRSRVSLHMKIPMYMRKLLLGSGSDDHRIWIDKLMQRVKINWRGRRSLYVDATIHRSVRKIEGKRILLKVELHSEEEIKITLIDTNISTTFECTIGKKDVIAVLLFEQIDDVIRRDFGVEVDKASVRKILNDMARGPVSLPGEAVDFDDSETDKNVYATPLIDIMSSNSMVLRLAKQLEILISKIRKESDYFGYHIKNPTKLEFVPPLKSEVKENMNTDLRFSSALHQSEREGDLQGVIRARKQMIIKHMEDELNELALRLLKEAEAKKESDRLAAEAFEAQLLGIAEGDAFAGKEPPSLPGDGGKAKEEGKALAAIEADKIEAEPEGSEESKGEFVLIKKEGEEGDDMSEDPHKLSEAQDDVLESEKQRRHLLENSEQVLATITEAAKLTMSDTIGSIEEAHQKRAIERAQPGNTQEVRRIDLDAKAKHERENPPEPVKKPSPRPILGKHEKKVFEGGVKTTFKDTKNTWSGHVAITVYEMMAWAQEDGIGKRFKFEVYEPGTARLYTGIIEDLKHLRKILGKHGKDLESPAKVTEMILFIAKFRLWVVDNKITWDGEVNDEDAPPYRIEFETVHVYSEDKITPVNVGGDEDKAANKNKLIEAEKRRGKKISRLVRRVNGILMQLTTFETATSDEHRSAIQDSLDTMENSESGIALYEPPSLKIIGYDPRSKRKTIYIAQPAAILEVAGGIHSPYLDPSRRKELAKIACDSLALKFPKSGPPQLIMAWSGSSKEFAAAASAVAKSTKMVRSSAESVLKRTGKLFRSALIIGKVECVVTLYNQAVPRAGGAGSATGEQEKQLVVNIYSRMASEATELIITDAEQIARIGRTIASFPDGEIRSAAVRRLLRFIHCDAIPDMESDDVDRKVLHVVLRPAKKDFLTEYGQLKPTPPGEDIRPVGMPAVFLPLDTQGKFLYRCARSMKNLKKPDDVPADYIITVYTKSDKEGAERGLVIKFYERDTADTCILHLGPKELLRIAADNDEPHLVKEMTVAVNKAAAVQLDDVEKHFKEVTEHGPLFDDANKITIRVVKMMLDDVGLTTGPDNTTIPYLISKGRGAIPTL